MNENTEKNLKKIVEVSTRKAAIEEWRTASEKQFVPLYNYRLDHIEEVVELASHIGSGTEANPDRTGRKTARTGLVSSPPKGPERASEAVTNGPVCSG